jgi:voltage-gated potassium channel
MAKKQNLTPLQRNLHTVIFEADTPLGKRFDILLMLFIILSIVLVNLESVSSINIKYGNLLYSAEWILTIFFTIEYILRVYCSYRRRNYVFSFYGIIDLLAILPTYLSIFMLGTQSLIIIRALRLLRVFRIFKMVGFMNQGSFIVDSLKASRDKIFIFLFFIFVMVNIVGSVMYLVEGGVNPDFDSIPRSIYWAIVTMTTVGYGDISPVTEFGQFIAAVVMIMGYAVIAVPTGIVSSEMIRGGKNQEDITTQVCMNCGKEGHDSDAVYCKYCSSAINL